MRRRMAGLVNALNRVALETSAWNEVGRCVTGFLDRALADGVVGAMPLNDVGGDFRPSLGGMFCEFCLGMR